MPDCYLAMGSGTTMMSSPWTHPRWSKVTYFRTPNLASTPGPLTFDIEYGGPGSRRHVTLYTPYKHACGASGYYSLVSDFFIATIHIGVGMLHTSGEVASGPILVWRGSGVQKYGMFRHSGPAWVCPWQGFIQDF